MLTIALVEDALSPARGEPVSMGQILARLGPGADRHRTLRALEALAAAKKITATKGATQARRYARR